MGLIYAGSFFLCYIFFKVGYGPEFGYISTIIAYSIALFARLKLLNQMIPEFSAKDFFMQVIIKAFIVITISSGIAFSFKCFSHISNRYLELVMVLFVSLTSVAVVSYTLALSKDERETIIKHARIVANRIINNGWLLYWLMTFRFLRRCTVSASMPLVKEIKYVISFW